MQMRLTALAGAVALTVTSVGAWQQQGTPGQAQVQTQGRGGNQPQRDPTQTQTQATPAGTGVIQGRVLTADTGRPVKRVRVSASGAGRGMRTATTDDQGRYQITDLVAASYTITASKTGFVDSIYGQRRPLQPGTPLALADAQIANNIDLRLVRGGVITGHVTDEDGEPLARALVTIQRYQYVRGERQLSAAGADSTDDRGQYRVFGLPPGDYYVSASTTGLGDLLGRGMQQLAAGLAIGSGAALNGRGGPGGFGGGGRFGGPDTPEPSGYASTYFPGVISSTEAGKVTIGPGQEASGIDFQIQVVALATVSGNVAGADGIVSVTLSPQEATGGLGRIGGAQTYNGRATAAGTFSIPNVPPGRYLAVARSGGRNGDPKTAVQSILVNGQNVDGVTLLMMPGVTIAGNITVDSAGTPSPSDYSIFRVTIADAEPLPGGGGGPGGRGGRGGFGGDDRVQTNGSFTLTNIEPGLHYVRVSGGGNPSQGGGQWTLKSVLVGGADVADIPFEIKPGQNIDNLNVVMTDRTTDLSGTVRDATNTGAAAVTVIAFATDPQFWRSQSRRIATSRTGDTGAYRLHGLPPGDYFILAVDDVEQGEWYDPAFLDSMKEKAQRVTLQDGDKKSLDVRGPGL
jgi:protocatechuate 3,4-dioxygenase beta subunit